MFQYTNKYYWKGTPPPIWEPLKYLFLAANVLPQTKVLFFIVITHTLSLKSLSGHSSVCYKTSLNTGVVGQTGAAPPTSKLEKFLSWPLALSMLIYSNFQINGASGETLEPPHP